MQRRSVPLYARKGRIRRASRRLQKSGAGAASGLDRPIAGLHVQRRRQNRSVHAGAVSFRRLQQAHLPVQHGALLHVSGEVFVLKGLSGA